MGVIFFGIEVRGPQKSKLVRGLSHGFVGPPLKPPLDTVNGDTVHISWTENMANCTLKMGRINLLIDSGMGDYHF